MTGARLAGPLRAKLGVPLENVLVEPEAKSTGPALVWGTWVARSRDPEAVVLSTHADWQVPDPAGFVRTADLALSVAERTPRLVTVGVVPTRPETGPARQSREAQPDCSRRGHGRRASLAPGPD